MYNTMLRLLICHDYTCNSVIRLHSIPAYTWLHHFHYTAQYKIHPPNSNKLPSHSFVYLNPFICYQYG